MILSFFSAQLQELQLNKALNNNNLKSWSYEGNEGFVFWERFRA